jgi:sulfate permease, SulP family
MRRSPVPAFTSLWGYQREWLRRDGVAGLTVWAVLVPEALAYASIAGVSPVVGLYAAPGALVLYAAFGSSRHLVVGPMAATAALSAAAVGDAAAGNTRAFPALTVALALTIGVLTLAAGLLRLGFVANFISEPVLKGFIVGLALTVIVGQVPKLLGVGKGSGNFFSQLWHLVTHLGEAGWVTVVVGVGSLVLVLLLRRFVPAVPAPLVAVLAGILAVHLLGLGLGAANLASGMSSGMVVNGSLSKTAVNGSAGARTQASGLVVAVLTVITLLLLTGLFEDLPEAALAAVVIAALIELVDYRALAALYRASSSSTPCRAW